MTSLIGKIQDKLRHGLALQWLNDQLINVGIEITPFYWIRESARASTIGSETDNSQDFSFEELGPADMPQIAMTSGDRFVTLEELQKNIATPGIGCFALRHKGEIACFSWFNLNACSSYLRPIEMKANEAYLYDMYTAKPYRGCKLAPLLRLKIIEYLRALGKDTLYSISVCFNRPSIHFKKTMGAEFLELHLRVMLFKKFGFCRRIWTLSNRAPDVGRSGARD